LASTAWWPFLGLIFLVGVLFEIYPLTAFALMLAAVAGLAHWWQGRALQGVTYRRRPFYRRGFPGELVETRIEVENNKLLPLSWLRVEDRWASAVGPQDESLFSPSHRPEEGLLVNLFSLRWFEKARRTYTLLLRQRGIYTLGPARLISGDLFGLFESEKEDPQVDYLTVFPEPLSYLDLNLPTDDPFGEQRSRRRLYEAPNLPMGVRDYHPEDDFRRVHWPATARTGSLQVKVYQPVSARVAVICLNVSTLAHTWEGTDSDLLEHLVRAAAALAQRGLELGYRVGLVSNGCLAHADQPFRVPPGRSPQQLARLLTTLASVTPFVTGPFDRFLLAEAPRLPYGASLLVVTGLVTPALAETMLRLRQHSRRLTLMSFARESPPSIPGVTCYHLPFNG